MGREKIYFWLTLYVWGLVLAVLVISSYNVITHAKILGMCGKEVVALDRWEILVVLWGCFLFATFSRITSLLRLRK